MIVRAIEERSLIINRIYLTQSIIMFTRCVSSRMCSPCSRHSTGTIGASRGRRQSCNTSGRRCCWRRRSTLTSIGYEEARTRQVLDVYSSRFALVGCESTPRRRHRVSLPGTISANFASTLVLSFLKYCS